VAFLLSQVVPLALVAISTISRLALIFGVLQRMTIRTPGTATYIAALVT